MTFIVKKIQMKNFKAPQRTFNLLNIKNQTKIS